MSDELRLPDELAACEARLAAMPLPASRIDRDELMYRAGWAAGVAGAGASTSSARLAQERAVSRRSTATLCAASAAIAASLAVVLSLQLRPDGDPGVAANAIKSLPQIAAEAIERPRVEQTFRRSAPLNLAGFDSGLIALRQQAMMNAWPQQTSVAASLGDAAAPAASTARDIMQDLLPAESSRQTGIWPWKLTPLGDSI